jgi:phosphatidylinositol kinase/protein kinase (PI-3  family)
MSDDCGLIETIQDAISIHSIKKQGYKRRVEEKTTYSLHDYFLEEYRDPEKLQAAQECFMMSLAGYSIVSYLLQVKDRYGCNRCCGQKI